MQCKLLQVGYTLPQEAPARNRVASFILGAESVHYNRLLRYGSQTSAVGNDGSVMENRYRVALPIPQTHVHSCFGIDFKF